MNPACGKTKATLTWRTLFGAELPMDVCLQKLGKYLLFFFFHFILLFAKGKEGENFK
jgi:hypothetical protein